MEQPIQNMKKAFKEVDESFPEDEDDKDYFDDYKEEKKQTKSISQPTMFPEDKDANLIKELLQVDWNRIEHLIRGHKPVTDADGNERFIAIEEHYLNDYGVTSIIQILSWYLDKNIFLARYSLPEINKRMGQFNEEFTHFVYDNANEFGMDTPQKKKWINMFVHLVIDMVDAAYSKALEGKTTELILKQFQVIQNEPINDNLYRPGMPTRKPSVMQRIFG